MLAVGQADCRRVSSSCSRIRGSSCTNSSGCRVDVALGWHSARRSAAVPIQTVQQDRSRSDAAGCSEETGDARDIDHRFAAGLSTALYSGLADR